MRNSFETLLAVPISAITVIHVTALFCLLEPLALDLAGPPSLDDLPVGLSSLRSTGHELPSALASDTSSLVPRILNVDLAASMGPNSGTTALYLFGVGVSVVGRSRSSCCASNTILAVSLLIFFRKKDAITELDV